MTFIEKIIKGMSIYYILRLINNLKILIKFSLYRQRSPPKIEFIF